MVSVLRGALFLLLVSAPAPRADVDGDGVEDESDNCLNAPNANQQDSGGLSSSLYPDGIGNVCQCGDPSGNGLPDMVDAVFLGRQLAAYQPAVLHFERCDVEPGGSCDTGDLVRLREALAGLPPGLEAVCAAAQPQALCGNAVAEPGERCDGEDMGGNTCASLGHDFGYLTCRPTCAFNASGCYPTLLVIAVGDSLVHDFAPGEVASPGQGWMHALPSRFATGELVFEDHARSGASSKSFRDLGYWTEALATAPRWVLIEFGHNDARLAPELHTVPSTTYRANLHAMVIEARAIGAEPIFVTLPPHFYVAQDGFHVARPNGLESYVAAMRAQALEDAVSLVELHAPLMEAYDLIGITLARSLYSYENPPNIPNFIHFSSRGASLAADTIAAQLALASPSLGDYLLPAP